MKSSKSILGYRSDIDGLRAVAVLSVVAFHLSPRRFKGGFVGVDIFFVISGFLISSIIYNELESGTFSIIEFYVRRIRRIYPALFIVLASVCVAGWFFVLPSDFLPLGKQIIGGSTFIANFVLWWQSGYFSPGAEQKPLLHLWTLGVEEQFYLIFPLICIVFYRAKSRWALPIAFLAIAIISMALNVVFINRYTDTVFFLPFSRFWELFVGAGLSLCLQRNLLVPWESHLLAKWRTGIGLLGLVALAVSIFGINQEDLFPGWWALLPTLGAALVIAAGESSWANRHILSFKPAVFVGLISYPLYLWHWPILSFLNIANSSWGFEVTTHMRRAGIVLAFVLAYLTYQFVELPIRRVKQRERRRRGALWLLGCVFATGAFGALVVLLGGIPARVSNEIAALDHTHWAELPDSWRDGTCFLRPDQFPESFSSNCVDLGEGHAAERLVLIWGDSHAADLIPGLRVMQRQSGVRLAQYTASLCAPIVGLQVKRRPACESVNNAVLNQIRVLKPQIVVLSASWSFLDFNHSGAPLAEKLLRTIELVKAAGVQRVVVIGSRPEWTNTVPKLLIIELRRNPNNPVPFRLMRSVVKTHDDTVLRATAERAGAVYVPVFEFLCDQTSCLATTGPDWKDVLTFDDQHLTQHGATLVAQRIWPSILGSGK